MVKFAHIADIHLGGWKIPEMELLNSQTFETAIDTCIKEKVDFVLIAGDFFDSAMPSIEALKLAAAKLRELKEEKIPCYLIPGSHDFSASGKTFLDVLHSAGLCSNVHSVEELEVFEEEKAIIAGIAGYKTSREQEVIRNVKVPDLSKYKDKPKICMLHTTIKENCPHGMAESLETDDLPKGFDYYALGHIHIPFDQKIDGKHIVYPGPLFPNSFSEIEELENGRFVIVDYDKEKKSFNVETQEIKLKEVVMIDIDADNKVPEIVTSEILGRIKKDHVEGKIVLLRVKGVLSSGKTSDVDFKYINKEIEKRGCYAFLKNVSKLESPEFAIKVNIKSDNIEEIEKEVMDKQRTSGNEFGEVLIGLLESLDIEKYEGEKTGVFEKRVVEEAAKTLGGIIDLQ
ncbi:exonuclease SbcCD subunit D [Nanoarchaeota archaeon]